MKDITVWATGLNEADAEAYGPPAAAGAVPAGTPPLRAAAPALDDAQYLQEIAAESMGWQPLDAQSYVHVGAPQDTSVLHVVGVADLLLADENVVLVNY